jgi:hypothetical protein
MQVKKIMIYNRHIVFNIVKINFKTKNIILRLNISFFHKKSNYFHQKLGPYSPYKTKHRQF